MSKKKLFSPIQAGIGAFCGGPLATTCFLKLNFDILEDTKKAKLTLLWGLPLSFLILVGCFFLPQIPGIAIGFSMGYAATAQRFTEQYQLSKKAIEQSELYEFESNWKVAGISLLGIVIYLAMAMAVGSLLHRYGLISE